MSQSDGSEGRINTELQDRVFLIGIDRPAKLNGFTPQMLRGMVTADVWQGWMEVRIGRSFRPRA